MLSPRGGLKLVNIRHLAKEFHQHVLAGVLSIDLKFKCAEYCEKACIICVELVSESDGHSLCCKKMAVFVSCVFVKC